MENTTLALDYFKLKEKALLQREYIDYTMAEHEKKLKEDGSVSAKAQLEDYQKEKESQEQEFNATIAELQPIFDQLYSKLEQIGAGEARPLHIREENLILDLYIDGHKNIHYLKK